MGQVKISLLHQQYAGAMARRRPDSVLPFGRFRAYVKSSGIRVIGYQGSFLVGQERDGIFHPSHFSTRGPKSSVELLRRLRERSDVIFTVTPDLAGMLARLGYKPVGLAVMDFRGTRTLKVVLVSRYRVMAKALTKALARKVKPALNKIKGRLAGLFEKDLPINLEEFYK